MFKGALKSGLVAISDAQERNLLDLDLHVRYVSSRCIGAKDGAVSCRIVDIEPGCQVGGLRRRDCDRGMLSEDLVKQVRLFKDVE